MRTLSVLIHGLSKVGKSTFASTCPKPMLYIDVEGGSRFLPFRKVYWDPMTEAPPVCDGTWDTAVVTIGKDEYQKVEQTFAWLNSGQHCFLAVAIDSVSELQQRLVDQISGRDQMQTQNWGEVFRSFMGLIRDYHGLTQHPTMPMSVVLVAMSKEGVDGKLKPFAQGQSQAILPYIVDVLAAADILQHVDPATGAATKYHRFTTGPHARYETGERVGGRIPEELFSASMPLLLDYVFGPEPSAAPAAVEPPAAPVAVEPQ